MPIFAAIGNGHTEVVEFLAHQEKFNPSVNYYGYLPIFFAILMEKLDIVKILVPLLQNVNCLNPKNGDSLIHISLRDYRIFEYLITLPGIDPNLKNNSQKTPLQLLSDWRSRSGYNIPNEHVSQMKAILVEAINKTEKFEIFKARTLGVIHET